MTVTTIAAVAIGAICAATLTACGQGSNAVQGVAAAGDEPSRYTSGPELDINQPQWDDRCQTTSLAGYSNEWVGPGELSPESALGVELKDVDTPVVPEGSAAELVAVNIPEGEKYANLVQLDLNAPDGEPVASYIVAQTDGDTWFVQSARFCSEFHTSIEGGAVQVKP